MDESPPNFDLVGSPAVIRCFNKKQQLGIGSTRRSYAPANFRIHLDV
jgi:hypothetical protein